MRTSKEKGEWLIVALQINGIGCYEINGEA